MNLKVGPTKASWPMDTIFDNWVEWKRKCDLRLCGPETQTALQGYVGKRLHKLVSRSFAEIHRALVDTHELNAWQCWDLFEGFYADVESRTGRRYKDWLFATVAASSDDHVDVMEREVNELLYNVVRQFVRTHYPRQNWLSLDAPLQPGEPDSVTLYAVVSRSENPTWDEVEKRDAQNTAARFAGQFFALMTQRERVALAVRGLELPVSCHEAEEAARCKKSMLSDACHQVRDSMQARLRREFPEDVELLSFYVTDELVEKCITWAKGEASCEPIFRLLAQRQAKEGCR